jgi:deoxyribonuclease-4
VLAGDFGHLGEIFSRVREPGRLGVCFDTCHAFAAGYDLRRREGYEEALASLERAVGKGKVLVVHTNDAKGELGGRLDRHEQLGRGRIGLECFRLVMNDPRFREVPKILETPKEEDGLPMDRVNLALLRALEGAKRLPPRLLERRRQG